MIQCESCTHNKVCRHKDIAKMIPKIFNVTCTEHGLVDGMPDMTQFAPVPQQVPQVPTLCYGCTPSYTTTSTSGYVDNVISGNDPVFNAALEKAKSVLNDVKQRNDAANCERYTGVVGGNK